MRETMELFVTKSLEKLNFELLLKDIGKLYSIYIE